jgi:hypothetical protein
MMLVQRTLMELGKKQYNEVFLAWLVIRLTGVRSVRDYK